jgi:uncharacterized RDD family membrane protein YckC
MKISTHRSFRLGLLALCCVLLSTARAQGVAGKDTQTEAPAIRPDPTARMHDDEAAQTDGERHGDDDWSKPPGADFGYDHHHGHRRNKHHSDDVVSIGHSAELPEGQHATNVVAVFGTAISAGEVYDSVVSVIGGTHVTGRVGNSAVAVMGGVYVNGQVDGDVVAVLGNVELGPQARIRGDVVVVGGVLTRDPNATIEGHVQSILSTDLNNFGWLRPWIERCLLYGRPLAFAPGLGWAWSLALGLLAFYVFLAFLFTGAVDRCVQTLERHPGQSVLAALLTVLLTPVTFVLLCITVLGILAIPFLALGLLCATVFGKVVVLATIGRRCTAFLANNPVQHTVIGVLVGGLIALVLYTIPVVGFILFKLLGILGLGVVVYTVITTMSAARAARGDGGGAQPGGGGPHTGAAGPGSPGVAGGGSPSAGPASGGYAAASDAGAASGAFAAAAAGSDAGSNPGTTVGTAHDSTASAAAGSTSGGAAGRTSGAGGDGNPNTGAASPATGPTPYINRLSFPRAGFWIRMGALLLDAILIGILLGQITEGVNQHLIVLAAYGVIMWKLKSATVGGLICGLQVVRLDGRPIDWPTAIVRALTCFLSLAVVGLGFLWIAIDENNQAWHDKVAGTVVVRAPKGTSLL